jgi:NitT/TauT family transport system permease protein/taurine transport system permease protein
LIPLVVLIVGWLLLPKLFLIPSYKLPTLAEIARTFIVVVKDGTLVSNMLSSLARLGIATVLGAVLGWTVGLGIARNRSIAAFLQPLVAFMQSIAGIAWVPLAIIWFGYGIGPTVFVVANGVFFIVLFNTVVGIQTIASKFEDVVRTLGGTSVDILTEVILPGALANVLTGLRLGVSFGWRSLVAAEVIAGSAGLGYMAESASQRYDTPTVLVSILTIGFLWLALERFILQPIEACTIERWGLVRRT